MTRRKAPLPERVACLQPLFSYRAATKDRTRLSSNYIVRCFCTRVGTVLDYNRTTLDNMQKSGATHCYACRVYLNRHFEANKVIQPDVLEREMNSKRATLGYEPVLDTDK